MDFTPLLAATSLAQALQRCATRSQARYFHGDPLGSISVDLVKSDDTKWFFSIQDTIKTGSVVVHVTAYTFKDEAVREAALKRLSVVLARYGAQLQLKVPAPKNPHL